MASHYVPAFCTSPPPLDSDGGGAGGGEYDDDDDDDFRVGVGRLKSIDDALRYDSEDDVSAPPTFAIAAARLEPDCIPNDFDHIVDDDADKVIDSRRSSLSPQQKPENDDDDDDDDDFGSFEVHEGATTSGGVDDVHSECADVPVCDVLTDATNSIDQDRIIEEEDGDVPLGDTNIHSKSSSPSESVNGDLRFRPDHDCDDVQTEMEGNEDEEDLINAFQVSSNSNIVIRDDQHSENTFPTEEEEEEEGFWAPSEIVNGMQPPSDSVCFVAEESFVADFQDALTHQIEEPAHEKDDFASFATFDEQTDRKNKEANDGDDDWGDFTQDVRVSETVSDDDDDEFGEFDSAQGGTDVFTTIKTAVGKDVAASGTDQLSELLALAFPKPSIATTMVEDDADESTNPELDVWKDLQDLENTNALTYHWSQSHSNRTLLKSLHVESRNLLANCGWNSSVPAFASTLTAAPLEPTKASPNEEKPTVATPPSTATREFTGPPLLLLPASSSSSSSSPAVPPVKFDWSGSGLVNPLDDACSPLLDLDFFVTKEVLTTDSSTRVRLDSLEDEFLRGGTGERPRMSTSATDVWSSPSPIIQKILRDSSAAAKETGKHRPATALSEEARRVIASLPDLSFLSAKVLMFPIRSQLP